MFDRNDHRHIGQRLKLFHFQEEAPGMIFWHPRGFEVYRRLEGALRRHVLREAYAEVRTPQVLGRAIWEASGHWQNFRGDMFELADNESAALKPVSCPGHLELIKRMAPSHRDLPVRVAEFGLVHRNEPSGALHGLFRLRQFTQDDGHVLCAEHQVEAEIVAFASGLLRFYAAFGFVDLAVAFSSRPAQRAGSDELWDRAEAMLRNSAVAAGLSFEEQIGQGAFYGPKLEFALRDRAGRAWQCGTIQLDLVLPERFDVAYVDLRGQRCRPVMLHRALLGSLERFLGILLEHHGGALPPWLAPEQVVVLPVAPEHRSYAVEIRDRCRASGLCAEFDEPSESLSRRVHDAHERGIPFVVVVGQREIDGRCLSIRAGNSRNNVGLEDGVASLVEACRSPF